MNYLDKRFSVQMGGEAYGSNWDRIFSKHPVKSEACEVSGDVGTHKHADVGAVSGGVGVPSSCPEGGGGYPEPLETSPQAESKQAPVEAEAGAGYQEPQEGTQQPQGEAIGLRSTP